MGASIRYDRLTLTDRGAWSKHLHTRTLRTLRPGLPLPVAEPKKKEAAPLPPPPPSLERRWALEDDDDDPHEKKEERPHPPPPAPRLAIPLLRVQRLLLLLLLLLLPRMAARRFSSAPSFTHTRMMTTTASRLECTSKSPLTAVLLGQEGAACPSRTCTLCMVGVRW